MPQLRIPWIELTRHGPLPHVVPEWHDFVQGVRVQASRIRGGVEVQLDSFTGNTDIIGIVIGNGDLDYPSDDNQIIFRGNVDSSDVSELDSSFGDIRQETGTFLLAPGFDASFGGSFNTINGVIAASGIEFFGNAGGTVNGSVINYGDDPMTCTGSVDLVFDRSGTTENPAGFATSMVLELQPESYSEPVF